MIRAAEGVILVSINGRAEDDKQGSRWYEVNRVKTGNDIDDYEFKDNGAVFMYRDRHQGDRISGVS